MLSHKEYGIPQFAFAIAYSRGRCARLRSERKQENPYRNDQIYFDIWLDAWEATEPPMMQRRDEQ